MPKTVAGFERREMLTRHRMKEAEGKERKTCRNFTLVGDMGRQEGEGWRLGEEPAPSSTPWTAGG
jgi:hypothetical protein